MLEENFYQRRYKEDRFICVIEDGTIYHIDSRGDKQAELGRTYDYVQELEATCKEYYDKLVELNVIVPEKTEKELLQENQKLMAAMFEQMKSMQDQIKKLEEEKLDELTKPVSQGTNEQSAEQV